jgi:hypothetical protein
MAVKLRSASYEYAQRLVKEGRFVIDERDAWSEHKPSALQESEFIEQHGIGEYAKWHLGVDDTVAADRKARYRFPYGDFAAVHRCGLLAAESRAGRLDYRDIELAAAHLHGMLEAVG